MKSVLFLCNGNYDRSRFAELLFNHRARQAGLRCFAFSRGVALAPERHIGAMAMPALTRLIALGVELPLPRMPRPLADGDFRRADQVIAVSAREQGPQLLENFPRWSSVVEYWKLDAVAHDPLEVALDALDAEVGHLVDTLAAEHVSA